MKAERHIHLKTKKIKLQPQAMLLHPPKETGRVGRAPTAWLQQGFREHFL